MRKNMVMRVLSVMVCLFMLSSLFVGCKATTETPVTTAAPVVSTPVPVQEILFWHFNKDEGNQLAAGFNKKYQDVKVNVEIIPSEKDAYQNKVILTLNSGGDKMPDVFSAEAGYVKRFVNLSKGYMDISKEAAAFTNEMYPYTVAIGTDKTGAIKALSHQATPGGFGYKRDLTLKYFGTDDPDKVAELVATPEKMLATGKLIAGKAKLFAGPDDEWVMFQGSRTSPWVKDGAFIIDPKVNDFLKFAKSIRDSKLDTGIKAWSGGWDTAIKDKTHIFFSIPTWGVPYIIGAKEDKAVIDTGRWGICKAPFAYSWGGTWFGVYQDSKKKDAALKFVNYLTTDKQDTKDRVKVSGDFSNIKSLNAELAADTTLTSKIIKQNTFALWAPLAESVNGNLFTEYDDLIKGEFMNLVDQYLTNKLTEADLIKTFKVKVATLLKDSNIKVD